jgi:hypothetical protein
MHHGALDGISQVDMYVRRLGQIGKGGAFPTTRAGIAPAWCSESSGRCRRSRLPPPSAGADPIPRPAAHWAEIRSDLSARSR